MTGNIVKRGLLTIKNAFRRYFNRSEWLLKLFKLEKQAADTLQSGLVIIQIDGLSHGQLLKAMTRGRMPFLRSLIDQHRYRQHDLYSGLPASTPGFQAELFYGIPTAVPAFSFRQGTTGQIVRMLEPSAALQTEQVLKNHATALLEGGASYSNIYSGGAMESNFCSASFGWAKLMSKSNPLKVSLFILLNGYSFIRTLVLLGLEFILACLDFLRGIFNGHSVGRELLLVPGRVGISVLLRELVTIGVKMDIARGLPVIHLNFLGYDEQSHRRGPKSAFAHWSLRGIDDAVKRIYKAAHYSNARQYQVWIHSDHGQEEATPYETLYGKNVTLSVKEVLHQHTQQNISLQPNNGENVFGELAQRSVFLGGGKMQKLMPRPKNPSLQPNNNATVVVSGPIGFIYLNQKLTKHDSDAIAKSLASAAHIPLVATKNGLHKINVFSNKEHYILPDQKASVLGDQHPFLHAVCEDLIQLVQHRDAGDFTLLGWKLHKGCISFTMENGSHAGPGHQETHAFALLPDNVIPQSVGHFIRAGDLYHLACKLLNRHCSSPVKKRP